MRKGDYKLIEFFEDGRLELYNLAEDVAEEMDLAEENPEILRQMHRELQDWRYQVDAQYPSENLDYEPRE